MYCANVLVPMGGLKCKPCETMCCLLKEVSRSRFVTMFGLNYFFLLIFNVFYCGVLCLDNERKVLSCEFIPCQGLGLAEQLLAGVSQGPLRSPMLVASHVRVGIWHHTLHTAGIACKVSCCLGTTPRGIPYKPCTTVSR